MIASKIDLTKTDKTYYAAKGEPEIRQFKDLYYLTISGQSAPEDNLFLSAIETIYAAAFGIKFICKGEDNDFTVPKMECFWYVDGGPEVQHLFPSTPREKWMWKILIRMPEFVNHDHFFRAMRNIRDKKKELDHDRVKFELIKGGKFAQILHLGSYEKEEPTLKKLHAFLEIQGLQIDGYHREIYLSDPRKVAEEKLRTILRYRVKQFALN